MQVDEKVRQRLIFRIYNDETYNVRKYCILNLNYKVHNAYLTYFVHVLYMCRSDVYIYSRNGINKYISKAHQ